MNNYQVGDVLRIRQWDDMVNAYGYDDGGGIACPGMRFAPRMRDLCGEIFTVKSTIDRQYHSKEGIELGWCITAEMLEPYFDAELSVDLSDVKIIGEFLSAFQTNK